MHTLIHSYDASDTIVVDGATFPSRCLIEDEDGIRILLTHGIIKNSDLVHALGGGAAMIVRTEPEIAFFLYDVPAVDNIRHEESTDTHFLDSKYWTPFDHLPTYFEAYQKAYAPRGEVSDFVHIHVHSEFSPLDGLSTPDEMVEAAGRMGHTAMGITDHGTCAGQPVFQIACDKAGIKAVLGIEAYFQDDRFARGDDHRYGYWHLILIAQTQEGLRNLWAMSTESYRDGNYDRKPRMDWETLERYSEGVICSTACLRGPVVQPYLAGDTERAVSNLGRLKAIFGDRLYAEIHANSLPDQMKANRWLVETARTHDVPLVAVVDSHYPHQDDADAHRVWLSVSTGREVTDDSTLFQGEQDYSLRDEVDVRMALGYLAPDEVDEAIANTKVIADQCTARIEKRSHMPVYSNATPEHLDPMQYDRERLYELCMSRWDERTVGKAYDQEVYLERFEREFGLISDKSYCGYFLIVWDIILHAKKNGIFVSPGRGSGGGCLIAYLLGITEIDPVQYDILFERFMTKGRTELPDFDCVPGNTQFHRDGPGDRTVGYLHALLHGRPEANEGECEVCGVQMDVPKRGYKGNPSSWLCPNCYKKRHHLKKDGLPTILGRNVVGRLSNQPLTDVIYRGIRETIRVTVSDGRFIESTPEHRHLTTAGWREAKGIQLGDLLVLMDDRGRRASHTDNLDKGAKDRLVERAEMACEMCSAKAPRGESWLGKFEVAHLDYSTKNIENMLFLCVSCHRKMDAQLGTPVVIRPVTSLQKSGEQQVFDVVMGHEDHSWVANGFVTHNCDFPSSKKQFMFDYVSTRWGADHMAIVGTHMRLKNKSIFKDVSRALKSQLPEDYYHDFETVSKIVDVAEADTAGLGLSWEQLFVKAGDELEPFREKYPQVFLYADKLNHRLKSFGTHPAGIVIDTEASLVENLPLRSGENGMVTQFDLGALESLGYVKFDLLNIRNLDTLQLCKDLIAEKTGRVIDPYAFTNDELEDPAIFDQISEGWTLGMFQINTHAGTRLCTRYQPRSLVELAHVLTLVRPGPSRSGLTELYLQRRETGSTITYDDERLKPILASTNGVMLFQEQLMQICLVMANYTDEEADKVRKILGKKKIELAKEEGRKFIAAAIANDTEEEVAVQLWEQMEEFAKYCVSGDTRIHLAAAGPHSDGTVEVVELYRRLHSKLPPYSNAGSSSGAVGRPKSTFEGPCVCCGEHAKKYARGYCQNKCEAWYRKFVAEDKGLYALSYYADGRIRPARILDVVESGEQELYRITLADGHHIDATANHRHLTPEGYRKVRDLNVGDSLVVDGGYEMPTREETEKRLRLTVGDRQNVGEVAGAYGKDNYGYIDGGHAVWSRWRAENIRVCAQCGSTVNVQQAHLDGNHQNNVVSNYAWLCQPCHLSYDYAINNRRRRWEKGHISSNSDIISIVSIGRQMTYDVVMEAPHNFVANGIVTHNSFGYAHSIAYAMLTDWTGWFKVHYPLYFLCAALSSVKAEEIPTFVEEARRMGYNVLPPDINLSGRGFTVDPANMAVRYGLESLDGLGGVAVDTVLANQPYTSWEDFEARRGSKCNSKQVGILNKIGAFESITGHRRWLEKRLELEAIPSSGACVHRSDILDDNDLPCSFDWTSLPATLGKSGKLLKKQPGPPKTCSRACKQFVSRKPDPPELVATYTDEDIRRIEDQILGVFLSSTPFDRLSPEDREECSNAEEVLSSPNGRYLVAALIKTVRRHIDSSDHAMAFLTVTTERGQLPVTVFASTYADIYDQLVPGSLCLLLVRHDERGQVLDEIINLDLMED